MAVKYGSGRMNTPGKRRTRATIGPRLWVALELVIDDVLPCEYNPDIKDKLLKALKEALEFGITPNNNKS
jgi:hypothetical protein